jgi:hypothetical protein
MAQAPVAAVGPGELDLALVAAVEIAAGLRKTGSGP